MTATIAKKHLPSEKLKKKVTCFSLFAIVLVALSVQLEFNPALFFTEGHHLINLLNEMLPPNINILWERHNIFASVQETIAMAFLGTIIGGLMALIVAFLAARNTSPSVIIRMFFRLFMSVERVIPKLVTILVFVIAMGLGPFAGMLTLTLSTIGMFGKLFADAIEEVDNEPVEAVYAIGANKWQAIRFSIIPQVIPSFIANFFYAFDVNLRAAIGLGIFGGGGIGFEIHMAMKMLRYSDALALILFTIVFIMLFEKISDHLRARILNKETLR
ncbi:MAG: phosphonate ABC transporter, permease protein PhnE [Cytophagales bacterium]|nr:phosphonate ABC transporter, permease protein PhnE [Cytophagales bacterium]